MAVKKDNKLMVLLSVWGILLVVLGHSGFEEPMILQKLRYLHRWIYSFHMPLFFMISGYLYSLTNKKFTDINIGKFVYKKAVRLLLPYMVLGVILYGIKFAFSGLSHATREFSVVTFFKMFVAPGCEGSTMGYLWYVFTLFVVFVIMLLLIKMHIDMKNVYSCIIIMAIFWGMHAFLPKIEWLNWSAVCQYLPFFVMGIMSHKYESSICVFTKTNKHIKFLILLVLSIFLQYLELPFDRIINYIIKAFVGLMMSIQLCVILLEHNWVEKLLSLGNYTYSIYLLSWFGQYAAKIVLVNILHTHWIVVVVMMFLFGLIVPLLICKTVENIDCLNKRRWLRNVLGY